MGRRGKMDTILTLVIGIKCMYVCSFIVELTFPMFLLFTCGVDDR